jgi:hypothetical protein
VITTQGLLLGIAGYVRDTIESPGGMFIGPEAIYCSAALAFVVPVVGAAIATGYTAIRYRLRNGHSTAAAAARPSWRNAAVRALFVGLALGFAIRGALSYGTTCGRHPPSAARIELNGR